MSYQVLARKYRPQNFGDVRGQEPVTRTLQNALAKERIHHAYLFTGARGIGKTTVARILAKALNCENRKAGEPCDECASCAEITKGISMDVQEIDGASNTSVDDIREIREQVKYTPAKGKYKAYIIDEVHMLSTSAFNALLKTLEEPPEHVVFIFATTEVHKIPATILSRCQRYDFRRISTAQIIEGLSKIAAQEKIEVDAGSLQLIAKESQGSLRDAQSLLDQAIAFSGEKIDFESICKLFGFIDRSQLMEFVGAVVEKKTSEALQLLEVFFQAGVDLNRLVGELTEKIRNLFLISQLGQLHDWLEVPEEEGKWLLELSQKKEASFFDQMLTLLLQGADDMARLSYPKMVFEVLLARLGQIEDVVPLEQILDSLKEMPRSASQSSSTNIISSAKPSIAKPSALSASSSDKPDFLTWLKKKRPQVSSILSHARLVLENEKLIVTFGEEGLIYADMLKESDRKKVVENLLAEFYKRQMQMQIVVEEKNSEEKISKQSLQQQALKHDVVQQAADILGARVYDVKTK